MSAPTKAAFLRRQRCFHAAHLTVTDPVFSNSDFFDPRDLLQVKYEMLRRARVDGWPAGRAARAFALGRTSYHQADRRWRQRGLLGLLSDRPGPRRPHKLAPEVVALLKEIVAQEGPLPAAVLAQRLSSQRSLSVHPRSIEKALAGREKGGRRRPGRRRAATGPRVTRRPAPPGCAAGPPPVRLCCCAKGCWPGCLANRRHLRLPRPIVQRAQEIRNGV